jgi:murein DD-endopeptidase MepM/ murein hydrolase activator NlpD
MDEVVLMRGMIFARVAFGFCMSTAFSIIVNASGMMIAEPVICVKASQNVAVKDGTLSNDIISIEQTEPVQFVQSFGNDKLEKTVEGVTKTYVHVQFTTRSEPTNRGWVDQALITEASQCVKEANAKISSRSGINSALNGEAIDRDYLFPVLQKPTDSYRTGMRRFGASRSGGRLHAACDIYRTQGEPVVAVSDGIVVRGRYAFYEGTYAIEIRNSDGKVIRYGEVTGKAAAGVVTGATIRKGQIVGYVGKVNSNCCSPMLHFEMYAGTSTGSLTQGGNKFQRRSDLMDATDLLDTWAKSSFGNML